MNARDNRTYNPAETALVIAIQLCCFPTFAVKLNADDVNSFLKQTYYTVPALT